MEDESADAEVTDLLNRMETEEQEHAAFGYLQMFRMEALHGAEIGKGRADKVRLVEQARNRLKQRLKKLLGMEEDGDQ